MARCEKRCDDDCAAVLEGALIWHRARVVSGVMIGRQHWGPHGPARYCAGLLGLDPTRIETEDMRERRHDCGNGDRAREREREERERQSDR